MLHWFRWLVAYLARNPTASIKQTIDSDQPWRTMRFFHNRPSKISSSQVWNKGRYPELEQLHDTAAIAHNSVFLCISLKLFLLSHPGYRVHEDDRKLAKLRMCHLEDIERTSECSTSGENKSTGDTDKKKNVHLDCDNTNSVDVDKLRNKSDTSESGDSSDRNKPNAEKSGHDAEKLTNRKKHHVGSAKTPLNRFSRKTAESGGKSKSNSKYLDNFDSLGNEDEYQTVSKEDKIPPLPPTVCDNKKKRDDKKKRGDFDNNRTSVVAEIHAVDSELLSKRRTSHGSDSNISSASELGASASHPTPGVFFPQYDGDSASDPRAPSPSQEYIQTLSGHRNIVTHCHVLERYIVSSSLDCTVRVWDRRDGQMLEILNCGKPVHCIQCVTVQDGEVILFTALDIGKVLAWKLLTNHALEVKRVAEYSGHLPNPIRAMDVSGDNATMATGCCFTVNQINPQRGPRESVRGTVKLWELSSMLDDCVRDDGHFTDKPPKCAKTMHQLMTHTLRTRAPSDSDVGLMPLEEAWWGIRALLFTPDASRLVIGFGHPDDEELYDEGLLAVCSAETLETLWVQDRRMCQVTSLHFQPVAPDDSQDFDTWQMVVGTQNCLSKVTLVFIGNFSFFGSWLKCHAIKDTCNRITVFQEYRKWLYKSNYTQQRFWEEYNVVCSVCLLVYPSFGCPGNNFVLHREICASNSGRWL